MAKSEAEWKKQLNAQEYNVLREKGTERAGTGEYDKFYPKAGHFVCRGCGLPLYSAESKFKSGCGWPAFDRCYKGAVRTEVDSSFGMRRVEIMCSSCGGHLGHVFEGERRPGHLGYSAARPRTASSFFEGERFTQTNERHCVNSVSVRFVKASDAPLPSTEQAPVAKG